MAAPRRNNDPKWAMYRDTIFEMYVRRNMTLEEARTAMAVKYQFDARSQFVRQFKIWRVEKRITPDCWKTISQYLKHKGWDTAHAVVVVARVYIDPRRLKKATSRHDLSSLRPWEENSVARLPPGVVVFESLSEVVVDKDIDLLKAVLEGGQDPNRVYRSPSPLITAIDVSRTSSSEDRDYAMDAAKLLLAHGADPNLLSYRKLYDKSWTPLETAIHHGHSDMVELLLQNGADPKQACVDTSGRPKSPVEAALSKFDARILHLLLQYGASISQELLDHVQRYWEDWLSSQWKSENTMTLVLDLLLDRGLPVDAQDLLGHTLLEVAMNLYLKDVAKLLLRRGANPNPELALQADGTPLQIATEYGTSTPVDCLLIAGADANANTGVYHSPLCPTLTQGSTNIIKSLLLNGAKADVACRMCHKTPIESAVRNKDMAVLGLLLVSLERTPERLATACKQSFPED